MRTIIIAILTIWISNGYAQAGKKKIFKKTQYMHGEAFLKTHGEIDVGNAPIDIYFVKKHFQSPDHLPQKLTDEQHRGQTVSLWRDPDGKVDFTVNWKYTYSYDSLGRVINYTYSSCVACSNMPYNYSVVYNSMGQVVMIGDQTGSESFKFSYDKKGDIVKFEEYRFEKLIEKVTLR